VLIVDDSETVRGRLAEMLAGVAGVEVAGQAASVAAARQAIAQLRPEAVILDLHLPDGNGLAVMAAARAAPPAPKFVVLTNYATPQYRQRCLADGASYFFDKSHEFERIPEALEQLARGGQGFLKVE
jgi:DNA-binding NarL/FixJ family response regulator